MKKIDQVFKNNSIRSFLISMLIFGIAGGLYSGVLNNFLAEILYISPFERGVVEFVRELPGLFLFLILALFYRFPETRIIRLAFLISFLGLGGLAIAAQARWFAIALIVLWSTGEHLMMPVRQSISIHTARPGREGEAIGLARSAGNVGSVLGFYLVTLMFLIIPDVHSILLYHLLYAGGAFFALAGMIFTYFIRKEEGHVQRPRLQFRRKFSRYYILEIFFGARKQIFMTFASYVLILNYGASTQLIATLYGIYSLANIFMNPLMGKLVDYLGYKKVLLIDSSILIILCLLYGFSHRIFSHQIAYIVICIVFVVDSMLFSVGIARAVYVKSISQGQDELTSTLTTGISVNHLVGIMIALLGGLLWEHLGLEMLFGVAAVLGTGSLIFTSTLPGRKKTTFPLPA